MNGPDNQSCHRSGQTFNVGTSIHVTKKFQNSLVRFIVLGCPVSQPGTAVPVKIQQRRVKDRITANPSDLTKVSRSREAPTRVKKGRNTYGAPRERTSSNLDNRRRNQNDELCVRKCVNGKTTTKVKK